MKKERVHNFLKRYLEDSAAPSFEAYDVSRLLAYGMLCVDTGRDIEKTIEWAENSISASFEGQVAPFCYPDTHIGPDVIFLLPHCGDYKNFRACIVQSKYVSEVSNQQDALQTLIPDSFYNESRGKQGKEKASRQLEKE